MKYLVIFIIIYSNFSFSQNKVLNDSIIHLEEIVLYEDKDNCHTIKTKGRRNASISVSKTSEFVSLINEIPNGKIKSLKLFFNSRKNTVLKKNAFRLKIYSVKDHLPHNEIINSELIFYVSKKKEFITLGLSPLELVNYNELFIGLELLDKNESLTFSIDCNTDKHKSNTYYKRTETGLWLEIPNINIRMEIEVNCN